MAAVVLLGNSAPSTETTFPRSSLPPLDYLRSSSSSGGGGKSRLFHLQDSTFVWARREPCTATSASASTWAVTSSAIFLAPISKGPISRGCCFRDGENRPLAAAAAWMWCRPRRSRPVAANFAGGAGGVGGGGESDEGDEGRKDWEEKLRGRLKELEEMKELERRAEELRIRMMSEEGGDGGETEEEKRERVRKKLEKAKRRETVKLIFDLGQKAYGKGMYARAIKFLEGALIITLSPKNTGCTPNGGPFTHECQPRCLLSAVVQPPCPQHRPRSLLAATLWPPHLRASRAPSSIAPEFRFVQ